MVVCDCVLVQEYKNKELVLTLGIVIVQEEMERLVFRETALKHKEDAFHQHSQAKEKELHSEQVIASCVSASSTLFLAFSCPLTSSQSQ
jgi:hypothetical protein